MHDWVRVDGSSGAGANSPQLSSQCMRRLFRRGRVSLGAVEAELPETFESVQPNVWHGMNAAVAKIGQQPGRMERKYPAWALSKAPRLVCSAAGLTATPFAVAARSHAAFRFTSWEPHLFGLLHTVRVVQVAQQAGAHILSSLIAIKGTAPAPKVLRPQLLKTNQTGTVRFYACKLPPQLGCRVDLHREQKSDHHKI